MLYVTEEWWGHDCLKVRVPFLDRDFLDIAMTLDPADKMIKKSEGRMEKYILRKVSNVSFGTEAQNYTMVLSSYCNSLDWSGF